MVLCSIFLHFGARHVFEQCTWENNLLHFYKDNSFHADVYNTSALAIDSGGRSNTSL